MNRLPALIFVCAAIAAAQDKVTVPLSDRSQPATVKARLMSGSITVKVGAGPQVVVESTSSDGRELPPRLPPNNVPPGMHRIDGGGGRGFTVEEDHNLVTIAGDRGGQSMNLVIEVPVTTSVELRTVNGGHIDVT